MILKIFKKILSIIDLNKDGKIQWWEVSLLIIGGLAAYYVIEHFLKF